MLRRTKHQEPEIYVQGEFVNYKYIILNGTPCSQSSDLEKYEKKDLLVKFDAASFSFVPKIDSKTTIQLETKRFYIEIYAQK
jgi:hypothetical protein